MSHVLLSHGFSLRVVSLSHDVSHGIESRHFSLARLGTLRPLVGSGDRS